MPYCPDCKAEYRPGFTTCVDCNVPLVDSLPVEPVQPIYRAVLETPLGTFDNRLEAEIVARRLRLDGIPSIIVPLGPGASAWADSSLFRQGLRVRSSDFERARALLGVYKDSGRQGERSVSVLRRRRRRGGFVLAFLLIPLETIVALLIDRVIRFFSSLTRR